MKQTLIKITDDHYVVVDSNENITHTTNLSYHDNLDYIKLSLSEVKELIGEVDVEKKGAELAYSRRIRFGDDFNSGVCYGLEEGYVIGYNQAIEDNKDKKYTEEDVIRIVEKSRETGLTAEYLMMTFQPKTEWEVTFDEQDKLRLV